MPVTTTKKQSKQMDNTITQQSIMAQIAGLPKMEMPDLKKLWLEIYKEDAPRAPKTFLIRKLAYRIQELAFGGGDDVDIRIAQVAKQYYGSGGTLQKKRIGYALPLSGTRLVREYRGVEYQVTVMAEGYEFNGCVYTSLSKIAKDITGTAWSGPAFFGLNKRKGGRS